MSKFAIPPWSAMPKYKVSLEIMESGIINKEIPLNDKPTYCIGRNPEFCDVPVDDALMSRKHACIQHKSDGTVWLFDMGSTHGTYLNRQRINAGEFVQIKDGDFVRFGPKEERFFIVKIVGPEEGEEGESEVKEVGEAGDGERRGQAGQENGEKGAGSAPFVNEEKRALEEYIKKQKDKSYKELYEELLAKEINPFEKKKQKLEKVAQVADPNAVTWGIQDEALVYNDKTDQEIIRTDLLRMLPNLTGKHISKIEEFEKKQRKMKMLTVSLP